MPIVRPIAFAVSVSGLHRPPRWQRSTSTLVPALAAIHSLLSWANNTRPSPFAATSNVEANKRHEYEAPWRRSTRHFASSLQPSTTSGELKIILSWSEFYKCTVKPYVDALHEQEVAAGGSGWAPARRRRSSSPTPRSLMAVLDCMRQDWHAPRQHRPASSHSQSRASA